METETFYETLEVEGGYIGHLYKFGPASSHEITIHKTTVFDTPFEATDAIVDWEDDNGYEPEMA